MTLASFPEELLARILALSLAPPPPAPDAALSPPRLRVAPLLVSRQFLRIASPLFYRTLHLHSAHQAARALDTLARHPPLAHAIRRIVFAGIWPASSPLLALACRLSDLDVSLDAGPNHPTPGDFHDVDADAFCDVLDRCTTLVHLTLRKDPAVYLTHPRPTLVLHRLAQAVCHWHSLETVHFALRISASPATLPLARALSVSPRLRTVRAQLPAVWNNLLLAISTNSRLESIMLYTEPILGPLHSRPSNSTLSSAVIKGGHTCDDIEHAVLGTGLYMMEAKKHARFSELIRAGTLIIRTRATTLATLPTPSSGGTLLSAIRAKEVAAELMANTFTLPSTPPFTVTRPAHAQIV